MKAKGQAVLGIASVEKVGRGKGSGLSAGNAVSVMSRRESNKADKQRRIERAARELFSTRGYEATSLRQIADRAGVALGTLALYADDKRDMALMIFNEKTAGLHCKAQQAARKKRRLATKLMAFFSVFAADAALNIQLTRIHHSLDYGLTGRHASTYIAYGVEILELVAELIRHARVNKEIGTPLDDEFLAHHVFHSGFRQTFRWWAASDRPVLTRFIADLNEAMRLLVYGMEPARKSAPSPGQRHSTLKLRKRPQSTRTHATR